MTKKYNIVIYLQKAQPSKYDDLFKSCKLCKRCKLCSVDESEAVGSRIETED